MGNKKTEENIIKDKPELSQVVAKEKRWWLDHISKK